MNEVEGRLAQIRGSVPPRNHNARTIAALTSNPGCARRAIMDAAGVDKQRIAAYAGFPAPFGQSRFALARGNAFEAQVKANGCAELLRLLRERLGLPIPEVSYDDLNEVGGNAGPGVRHAQHANPAGPRGPVRQGSWDAVRPPAAAAAGRRAARLPGAGSDRLPAQGPIPRRGDQVVRGHRRPGRRGEGSRCGHPVRGLRSRAARTAGRAGQPAGGRGRRGDPGLSRRTSPTTR